MKTKRLSLLFGFLFTTGLLFANISSAVPLLRCTVDQGGSTQTLTFAVTNDPYATKAFDINDRFRFKAVVIGDLQHIEYIKIYVYDFPSRQPVLLHEAKYIKPLSAQKTLPIPLTGVNFIYSPRLERELQYQCLLLEATP